jgi:hypothetical protein
MALLLRWLHPDLSRCSERAVFAARVTAAWDDFKTAERRSAYDTLRLETHAHAAAAVRPGAKPRKSTDRVRLLANPGRRRPVWQQVFLRLKGRRS